MMMVAYKEGSREWEQWKEVLMIAYKEGSREWGQWEGVLVVAYKKGDGVRTEGEGEGVGWGGSNVIDLRL